MTRNVDGTGQKLEAAYRYMKVKKQFSAEDNTCNRKERKDENEENLNFSKKSQQSNH